MNNDMSDILPIGAILSQLPKEVDTFSLTTSYHAGMDIEHPYGIYGVTEEQAQILFDKIDNYFVEQNKKIYDSIDLDKYNLPDYDTFMEYAKMEANDPNNLTEMYGRKHLFLSDKFYSKKLKYTEPQELWHIFNSFNIKYNMLQTLKECMQLKEYRPLDCDLDNPQYTALKSYVVDIEVSFNNHCTMTTALLKTYYFKLTPETRKWLDSIDDIYSLEGLDDLAFYKGKQCVFSSCTHERYYDYIEDDIN
jgi:hypothetical protein